MQFDKNCVFWSSSLSYAIETRTRQFFYFVLFQVKQMLFRTKKFCEEFGVCFLVPTNELTESRKKLNERAGRISKDTLSSSLFVSCLGCLSHSDVCR